MKKLLRTISKRQNELGCANPISTHNRPTVHVNFSIGDKPYVRKGGIYQREYGFGFIKIEGKEIY